MIEDFDDLLDEPILCPIDSSRYAALMRGVENLKDEEIFDGWHFCWQWDGLLIHPSWPEADCCTCLDEN